MKSRIPATAPEPATGAPSYGRAGRFVQMLLAPIVMAVLATAAMPARAAPAPLQIVALGDSLTAGYMLPQNAAFPIVLERMLRADGFNVDVTNAGVSGDTSSDGLARVDWSVPDGTDAVLLELGANDMLRGLDPAITRNAIDSALGHLQARGVKVMLLGMLAAPDLGKDFQQKFDSIYPDLAKAHGVPLYPFFLNGVAGNAKLELADGMHPTPDGVMIIVKAMLPAVEAFLRGLPPKA